jgi:hypothetical protein
LHEREVVVNKTAHRCRPRYCGMQRVGLIRNGGHHERLKPNLDYDGDYNDD